jgi:hypothetical protein
MEEETSLVPAPFDRERHLPLLLEADDAEEHMRGYLDRGELLEIHDADGFRFAGVREGYFDAYPMAVVENGIRARDMVMFRMALPSDSTPT